MIDFAILLDDEPFAVVPHIIDHVPVEMAYDEIAGQRDEYNDGKEWNHDVAVQFNPHANCEKRE